ncbi:MULTISPECIES: pyridoxamine 5'-phosphate oxidase family protein [Streptomyces]|nr:MULTISPECIES: pyridoxamine 5'-phosphate oxidase family protein [Streptomyces]
MVYAFGVGDISVSVAGLDGGVLTHTIRAVGATSRALCAVRPGTQVGVRGPFGTGWDLPAATGRDLLVVADGIGLALMRPLAYERPPQPAADVPPRAGTGHGATEAPSTTAAPSTPEDSWLRAPSRSAAHRWHTCPASGPLGAGTAQEPHAHGARCGGGEMHADGPVPPHEDSVVTRCAVRRRQLGLTREELAHRAGMSVAYLDRVETLSGDFDPAALMRLAAALEMPYDELARGPREAAPGRRKAGPHPMLAQLSEDECWRRLGTHGIGRIGLSATGSAPVVLPVNFLVDGRTIVYRTEADGAAAPAEGEQLAFETDRIDEQLSRGWSVLITGTAEHITDPGTVESLTTRPGAQPWAGGKRDLWVRIRPGEVTGRTIHTR